MRELPPPENALPTSTLNTTTMRVERRARPECMVNIHWYPKKEATKPPNMLPKSRGVKMSSWNTPMAVPRPSLGVDSATAAMIDGFRRPFMKPMTEMRTANTPKFLV